MSTDHSEVIRWFESQPTGVDVELQVLSRQFGMQPERLRDQLSRLVDRGQLIQSEPVTGIADANPSYRLANPDM
jgi:hypothetical protein